MLLLGPCCASSHFSPSKRLQLLKQNSCRVQKIDQPRLHLHSRLEESLGSKGAQEQEAKEAILLSLFLSWIPEDICYEFSFKVTLLVHGEEGLRTAERTTAVLYKQDLRTLSNLSAEEARQVFQGAPYLR